MMGPRLDRFSLGGRKRVIHKSGGAEDVACLRLRVALEMHHIVGVDLQEPLAEMRRKARIDLAHAVSEDVSVEELVDSGHRAQAP